MILAPDQVRGGPKYLAREKEDERGRSPNEDPGALLRRGVAGAAEVTATSVVTGAVRAVRQRESRDFL